MLAHSMVSIVSCARVSSCSSGLASTGPMETATAMQMLGAVGSVELQAMAFSMCIVVVDVAVAVVLLLSCCSAYPLIWYSSAIV